MNLVDAVITECTSDPYKKYDAWWVDVIYESYGGEGKTSVMYELLDDARKLKVGDTILV